jgi:hypothetical protein
VGIGVGPRACYHMENEQTQNLATSSLAADSRALAHRTEALCSLFRNLSKQKGMYAV